MIIYYEILMPMSYTRRLIDIAVRQSPLTFDISAVRHAGYAVIEISRLFTMMPPCRYFSSIRRLITLPLMFTRGRASSPLLRHAAIIALP